MHKPVMVIKIGGNQLDEPGFIESLITAIKARQQTHACVLVQRWR